MNERKAEAVDLQSNCEQVDRCNQLNIQLQQHEHSPPPLRSLLMTTFVLSCSSSTKNDSRSRANLWQGHMKHIKTKALKKGSEWVCVELLKLHENDSRSRANLCGE